MFHRCSFNEYDLACIDFQLKDIALCCVKLGFFSIAAGGKMLDCAGTLHNVNCNIGLNVMSPKVSKSVAGRRAR